MDRVGATPRAPACTYARAWAEGFATPLFLERYRALVLRYVPGAAAEAISSEEAAQVVAR